MTPTPAPPLLEPLTYEGIHATLTRLLGALPDTAEGIEAELKARNITGLPGSSWGCPVANYLKAQGVRFQQVEVSAGWIRAYSRLGGFAQVTPPPAVIELIRRVDAGRCPDLIRPAALRYGTWVYDT